MEFFDKRELGYAQSMRMGPWSVQSQRFLLKSNSEMAYLVLLLNG
jgi:hypothetical protein